MIWPSGLVSFRINSEIIHTVGWAPLPGDQPVVRPLAVQGNTKRMKASKILCFHGDDYEEWRLLACYAVWLL
jgi:hypothetical protein